MSTHDHDHDDADAAFALRTEALEALMTERGLVPTGAIEAIVRHYEQDVGPLNGARVVARAWVDPAYRARLLADATRAIAEFQRAADVGTIHDAALFAFSHFPLALYWVGRYSERGEACARVEQNVAHRLTVVRAGSGQGR